MLLNSDGTKGNGHDDEAAWLADNVSSPSRLRLLIGLLLFATPSVSLVVAGIASSALTEAMSSKLSSSSLFKHSVSSIVSSVCIVLDVNSSSAGSTDEGDKIIALVEFSGCAVSMLLLFVASSMPSDIGFVGWL